MVLGFMPFNEAAGNTPRKTSVMVHITQGVAHLQ